MADHQCHTVGVVAEQLACQVQRNDSCTAAHASQAVVDGAGGHLEVVDDGRRQTGGGVDCSSRPDRHQT